MPDQCEAKMSLTRYLMYFSYIGKPFHGLQRQMKGGIPRVDDPKTVQGRIEMALKMLNPSYDPIVVPSSRTDSGVNALKTTCHVDLSRSNGFAYEPKAITVCTNRYFKKEDVPIRILKTFAVPEEFHCRHNAIYRTYLYRLAIVKTDNPPSCNYFQQFFPIEEMQRVRFICTDTFDLDAMKDAANLFVGEHDFRTFMGRGSHNLSIITRRSIDKFDIRNGRCLNYSSSSWPSTSEEYQYLDIYVQSRGFLYRQVRRMVSSLIAVAQGKVSSSDIEFMLQVPSHRSWNDKIATIPAYALYLCDVEYSEADKDTFKESLDSCNNNGERVTVERARGTPRGRDQWSSRSDHRSHERYGPPTRTNYRLIVENLSSRISWQDLKDYMRQAGEVTYADAHKQHRNEGVVEFAAYSDLKNAIEKLDDTELNGRRIKLVEDKKRSSRRSGSYSSRSRSRSRSPRRSRSRSRSRRSSRSKSKSRSASPNNKLNSKSRSRSNSRKKSVDRSRSNSRKKSVDRSRSRSRSLKRSKSRDASKGHSRSRSISKERSKSRSRSASPN